ncbi:MAG: hypothetical protein HXM95_05710 [Parvimonas micra]|nr:hypothetical protein [Parvimonas micra]
MTKQEAISAIKQEDYVIFNEIRYKIQALIYRYNHIKKKWKISAELLDKNKHAVIIAAIEKIELYQDEQD